MKYDIRERREACTKTQQATTPILPGPFTASTSASSSLGCFAPLGSTHSCASAASFRKYARTRRNIFLAFSFSALAACVRKLVLSF